MALRRTALSLALFCLSTIAAGCGSDDATAEPAAVKEGAGQEEAATGGKAASANSAALRADVLDTQAKLATSGYSAALVEAKTMAAAVQAFLDNPTTATLDAARQAWVAARPAYQRTEAWRFSDGQIDNGDNLEAFINAWPLDEVYIDQYIAGREPVTPEALHAANAKGGEENIATGWHAVEYLLWGKDERADGPGNRPATDFATGRSAPDRSSAERRRRYLGAVTDLLIADLTAVGVQWQPGSPYHNEFIALTPEEGLRRIISGLGTMSGGELGSQRIAVGYETKDQEDEHSCFSDTTVADYIADEDGIRRTYLGLDAAGKPVGPSLSDLVKATDPTLDQSVRAMIYGAVAAVGAMPQPFDRAITGLDTAPGRQAIKRAIIALEEQTTAFVRVAAALGVRIATEVP